MWSTVRRATTARRTSLRIEYVNVSARSLQLVSERTLREPPHKRIWRGCASLCDALTSHPVRFEEEGENGRGLFDVGHNTHRWSNTHMRTYVHTYNAKRAFSTCPSLARWDRASARRLSPLAKLSLARKRRLLPISQCSKRDTLRDT